MNEQYKLGLLAAALYLEGTAADYFQMAAQAEHGIGRLRQPEYGRQLARVEALREKAQLLRGQAKAIRELEKP